MALARLKLIGLVYGFLVGLLVSVNGQNNPPATIHTVFTTECTRYFTWQSLGMIYSHRKSGQPGPLTRLMSCTKAELSQLTEEELNLVTTHIAPSFTVHPRTGDVYSAYNKPVAVIDWLANNDVKEDYVLIIDADMIMRAPFLPIESGAKPGWAVAAFFGYMKGVNNDLALKHVPEVLPRNDTFAGSVGRRGDQVGGFTLMYKEDLKRVAPLWLKYTEDVRFDPDAWELTGDAYSTHKGDKPWISEMYGYSYACSKADVWHTCHHSAMLYPGYEVRVFPMVLHYGLLWDVKNTAYKFDKHWHYDFDALKCPPWNIEKNIGGRSNGKGGLFPHPPRPSEFKTTGFELMRDLLAIEVIVTLNEALCERHRRKCLPSEQLERECKIADDIAAELAAAYIALEATLPDPCADSHEKCPLWASKGECKSNPGYMLETCQKSCGVCQPRVQKAAAVGDGNARPDVADNEVIGGVGLGGGIASPVVQRIQVIQTEQGQLDDHAGTVVDTENGADAVLTTAKEAARQKLIQKQLDAKRGQAAQLHQQQLNNGGKVEIGGNTLHELNNSQDDDNNSNGDENTVGGEKVKTWQALEDLDNQAIASVDLPVHTDDNDDTALTGNVEDKIAQLKARCRQNGDWTPEQLERCLELAETGTMYNPKTLNDLSEEEEAKLKGLSDAEVHAQAHRLLGGGSARGEGWSRVHLKGFGGGGDDDGGDGGGRSIIVLLMWLSILGVVGIYVIRATTSGRGRRQYVNGKMFVPATRQKYLYGRVLRSD